MDRTLEQLTKENFNIRSLSKAAVKTAGRGLVKNFDMTLVAAGLCGIADAYLDGGAKPGLLITSAMGAYEGLWTSTGEEDDPVISRTLGGAGVGATVYAVARGLAEFSKYLIQ